MPQDSGAPSGPGSRAPHEAASASSPKASIPSAVTAEMLEATTHVAAWSGDWIHSDSLSAIYEAMKALDPEVESLRNEEYEFEIVLQEQAFIHGARSCREMMARFVEGPGSETERRIAGSIRANWHPGWGRDPGGLKGSIPFNALGETEEFVASAIEAQQVETKGLDAEHESAAAKPDAQPQPGSPCRQDGGNE